VYPVGAGHAGRLFPNLELSCHQVDGDPDLDSDLKAILLKAVDADPEARYPSMLEFHAQRRKHLSAHPAVVGIRRMVGPCLARAKPIACERSLDTCRSAESAFAQVRLTRA
jgi:hypothetical protein